MGWFCALAAGQLVQSAIRKGLRKGPLFLLRPAHHKALKVNKEFDSHAK